MKKLGFTDPQPLPEIGLIGMDDAPRALSEFRGKWVVLNFWATWCPYCRKEKPVIDAFWQDYRNKGFEVISISVDDPPDKIAAWMRDKDYAFMAAPNNASVVGAFGNVSSVPTSFIVDTEGRIRHKIAGQVHYPRLEKLVGPLLPEAQKP
ncbi:MAG TPA: hypothetical protein DEF16_05135 [Gemmobacter sp.]|nr:hypothetical protein [Gemmobacter sp.]